MPYDPDTTWLGLLGGGVSGSVVAGGSIYQLDLWHMGRSRLPVRVLVKGRRVGLVAEVGTGLAMLLVTGCRNSADMEGITSSGLDWEFSLGVKGSAVAKTGGKLFKVAVDQAAHETGKWVANESAKRLVQWAMDDLGVVKPGKQFNLLPSPLSFALGAGIFYDWQTLYLLGGHIGWDYISPKWSVETYQGNVRLQLFNIPEQDGTVVRVGLSVPEWGFDPYIRWKKKAGEARTGAPQDYQILGYAYQGAIFERRDGMGYSGINLTNFQPTGRLEQGLLTVGRTDTVQRQGKLKVRPAIFRFGNVAHWEADETVTMTCGSDGSFVDADGHANLRS